MNDEASFLVRGGASQSAWKGVDGLADVVREAPSQSEGSGLAGKTPLTVSDEAMQEAGLAAGHTAMADTLAAGVPVTVFSNGMVVTLSPSARR